MTIPINKKIYQSLKIRNFNKYIVDVLLNKRDAIKDLVIDLEKI
ncbi:MAG: hypothetical protein AABY22_09765 [Nanoarchaeota archaeon]